MSNKVRKSPITGFFRRTWKVLIGLVISGVALYLFIRMCNFREMLEAFKKTNYFFVFLTLCTIFMSYLGRGVRWIYLLRPLKRVGLGPTFSGTIIGFTASNILPLRAGEFVRAYVLAKNQNLKASATFATIVVERLCDGFCVLAILVLALTTMPFPESSDVASLSEPMQKVVTIITREKLQWFGYSTLLFYLGLITVLVLLKVAPRKAEWLVSKPLFFLPKRIVSKVIDLLSSFSEGVSSMNSPKQAFNVILWSLVVWVSIALGPWLLSFAFGLDLPPVMGLFVTVVLAFGVMLPSSPGFIGIFQLSTAAAMVLLGVPEQVSTTYALMLWVLSIVPVTILGFIFCWVGKTSFAQIIKATKQERMVVQEES